MKYSSANPPMECMQTTSTCYKQTRKMTPKGVLWHSTGANNPWLKRYVQPSDNAPDRQKMLNILGVNANKNDWNHKTVQAGLNAWIGKLADGTVTTVQSMPSNFRPWGCGSGYNGSCNDYWVQFEICEDGLNDKSYFDKVYQEACEYTAYICDMYGLDPKGTVAYNKLKVPVILCHIDSYNLHLGSGHGDVLHWFKKYGKTMDDVRNDVAKLLANKNKLLGVYEVEDTDMKYYRTINDVPTDYRPSVQKCMDLGALRGTGNGEINVSEDLCRNLTIFDRLGLLKKQ